MAGSSHDLGFFFGQGTAATRLVEASMTTSSDHGFHIQTGFETQGRVDGAAAGEAGKREPRGGETQT